MNIRQWGHFSFQKTSPVLGQMILEARNLPVGSTKWSAWESQVNAASGLIF